MLDTIPRVKFEHPDRLQEERDKLAKDSMTHLGYVLPGSGGALLNALRKLEMEPLVRHKVEEYKARKSKPGMWSDKKLGLQLWAAALVFLAVAVSVGYLAFQRWPVDWSKGPELIHVIPILSGIACLFLSIGGAVNYGSSGRRTTYKWVSCGIREYSGVVPEFILHKAVSLAKEVPSVTFQVQILTMEEQRQEKTLPDPFLVAKLGSEVYYLDVWDERDFEREL